MTTRPRILSRPARGLLASSVGLALAATALVGPPASAVSTEHGDRLVTTNPADNTPHAMNGSVNAMVQVGNKIIAGGTFTSVSPAATFSSTGDDLARNRIFAFDATTGQIDASFNPNLGGSVNSLTTDGTHVYVGGAFGSVGGNSAIKRVVKLTAGGAVVGGFQAVPSAAVNEVVWASGRLYLGGAFKSVKNGRVSTVRSALAALDPTTGAVLTQVDVPFTGVYDPLNPQGGGSTNIKRFDVSPDGRKLAAVGNFAVVAGQPRSQLAVVDLPATGAAALSSWQTDRYSRARNNCAGVFDSFVRDIDFSPDGTWFAVTTTGAFAGGSDSGTLCDTTARWEISSTGNDPTWADYSGGDTMYGVAVTGGAVYVGGHLRWMNNSFQGDQAGPGAVPREGIVALDPVNGLPLSWDPGRTRGVGAQALLATPSGLWVGSDTTKIGRPRETHGRIAFLPLAGGTTIPAVAPAALPSSLFLAQRSPGSAGNVLHRVNAGGPALQSADGPDWSTDSGLVSGGNTADWGSSVPVDGTVPVGTAPGVFATERWGAQDWDLPVPAGTSVTLRLHFANQYGGTAAVGQRVFDVLVDGQTVLDDFDIVAVTGDRRGTTKSFTLTSDGIIDVDLRNVVENPLINGIEVIDNTVPPGPAQPGALLKRPVDGAGVPTAIATTASTAMDFSTVRGAFLINGQLYYGLPDGGLYARAFDPATAAVGAQRAVNLYDDPDDGRRIPFAIADMTGVFYDSVTHRLYYTVFGDDRLFYRYFTPESEVVGAQTFVATSNGVAFGSVAGMTLASGQILYGSRTDGALRSVPFSAGAVAGSPTVLSDDGSWRYRAIFVSNS